VVEDTAEGLIVRDRADTHRFPALVYFQRLLWRESLGNFKLLPKAPHLPRIRLDGLVIQRETWSVPCGDLRFAFEKTESERFIGARRWARLAGLPRWVFARLPQELKPVYLDLASPASVEVVAKLIRRAAELSEETTIVSFSEMLPDPTQTWLVDGAGRRYTSELRIVAVDPEVWSDQPPA